MKEVEKSGVGFLVFEKLEGMRRLRHGVSRRRQRKEAGEELNFSLNDPERAAWARERFCGALSMAAGSVVRPRQVHGTRIAVVRDPHQTVGQADAVCTNVKQAPLMIVGADCPLILVYDPAAAALGLAHAGRRGTAQMIAAQLVRRMTEVFDCKPHRMIAGIGPGICGRCYQVGEEVANEFMNQFEDTEGYLREITLDGKNQLCRRDAGGTNGGLRAHPTIPPESKPHSAGRWYLDLSRANRRQLIAVGVPTENIEESNCCTFEQEQWFYSYRREGRKAGRIALLAGLAP